MDNSGILTISSAGELIITSNRSDPIELYAGRNGTNIAATLLNLGNFVLREMNINGSEDRILRESFDYPTDTLIPGMKLGFNNLKDYTNQNWRLNVKEFENIVPKPDVENLNYNFTNVSNGVEDYFSYFLIIDPKWTPERRKTISGWQMTYVKNLGVARILCLKY
ncbi:unnamed protein product [Fraxinus pennsylvanica]|uniref:Bulb-type lectin domain-containing protein n=1 Tax=Fraxinus pennsylvanica TaxID=56036 RepID=A0AAD1ZM15_9LAMI|nr:unnamed protein product [Fraxinus pennsylvanica]